MLSHEVLILENGEIAMKRALLLVIVISALASSTAVAATTNSARPSARTHGKVLGVLVPYEAKLKSSGIPVYLPSWVPTRVVATSSIAA